MKEKERRKRLDELLDRAKWTIDHRIVTETRRRRILKVQIQAALHYLTIVEMVRAHSSKSLKHINAMFPQTQYSDMIEVINGRMDPPHSTHELADLNYQSPISTFRWAGKEMFGAQKKVHNSQTYYQESRQAIKDAKVAQTKLALFMSDYKERFIQEKTDDEEYKFELPGFGHYNVAAAPLFNFIDKIKASEAPSDATS